MFPAPNLDEDFRRISPKGWTASRFLGIVWSLRGSVQTAVPSQIQDNPAGTMN